MAHNFSEEEKKILNFWEENKIFEKSLEKTKKGKPFVFYDGPPFATGTPHYGHLLQSVIKDAIPRYKTMQGFYVERQWGWDCHGLPIENIVEKELGIKTKKEIEEMGVKKFNDLCRNKIFTFAKEWERIIPRLGRWVDMENPYRTMDFEYMQSEWWAFKELYNKGLIYEGYKSMHICPRCETTLSQAEVAEGYKNVKDLSATVKFKVKDSESYGFPEDTYFLAWTTTPWTLIGNVVLAVREDINYVIIRCLDVELQKKGTREYHNLIISKEIFDGLYNKDVKDSLKIAFNLSHLHDESNEQTVDGSKVVKEVKGKDLVGLEYEPLFDYYSKDENLKNRENGWKVYSADFVTTEEGTGIVHIAPAFGVDDMEFGKEKDLPFIQHVKMDGIFKEATEKFSELDLKPRAKDKPEEIREADLDIVRELKEKGLLFNSEKYEHSYPHCWRCDTALLNYATSSWFVAVEKIKPRLLKTAKKINWSPSHIKEGRFGKWLEGARDWSISRQRFWANTIPVWRCNKCKKEIVFGSAKELEKASETKVSDLHKDIVDQITFTCVCNGVMQRVPDVLDTWFDSGSVPFATLHYPQENKNDLKKRLPADFIGEAQDQTRLWFYYQHVLSGALFGKEAFKNCIVTGIILSEDGKKMSKKLKNYPDPNEVIEKYGADAVRFYMLSSPVVQAENFSFSEKGVDEIVKKNISRLYNVLAFYNLYKNDTLASDTSKNILDKWILSRLNGLLSEVTEGYETYRVDLATRPLTNFIDDFSVWYLRRSRERFKEEDNDKKDALATLNYVLLCLSKISAPVMPFSAENIYQSLKTEEMPESVHLCDWPKINKKLIDKDLEEKMEEVRSIVNLALAERMSEGIRVKQPLASLKIKESKNDIQKDKELLNLISKEVNVKETSCDSSIKKQVQLDINITEDLKQEGVVREIIRSLQGMRKDLGLNPSDKISVFAFGDEDLNRILEKNKNFVLVQARATEILIEEIPEDVNAKKEIMLLEKKILIAIKKI